MADRNIEIYRGDKRTFKVVCKDEIGAVVNIAGASIRFSAKERVSDVTYKMEKKNAAAGGADSQINITDGVNGEYEIYLVPADTQSLDIGSYEYDSELTTSGGDPYTVVRGEFVVLSEISRP